MTEKPPVCDTPHRTTQEEDACESTRLSQRAEGIARSFHEAYEELAPSHGYETRKSSRVPWEDVPANNKNLMIAVVARLLEREAIR